MPFPQPSHTNTDVRVLVDLLLSASIGDVVTYEAMSAAIGSPVKRRAWLIPRAVKQANKEAGALFGTVINAGQKRLPATDAHVVGHTARRKVRRTSRRAKEMIGRSMEVANDIPNDAKRKAYAELNVLGLIEHISRDQRIEAVIEENKPLPVAKTMRLMMEQLGAI